MTHINVKCLDLIKHPCIFVALLHNDNSLINLSQKGPTVRTGMDLHSGEGCCLFRPYERDQEKVTTYIVSLVPVSSLLLLS